ncbi:MAG: polysaccharide biosynthesis tyrosine autokinase [Chloroflexota bacterium]
METRFFVNAFNKWWWLIVLATAAGLIGSLLLDARTPRSYRASTTLMVGQFLQIENPQQGDFTLSQQLAQSYALMVRRASILDATSDALRLGIPGATLDRMVSAAAVPQSQFIQIEVLDTDPKRATLIANELANQLIVQSPTPQQRELEKHRQFVTQQLTALQSRLEDAERQRTELNQRLAGETSARGVQDIQSQMVGLEQKIMSWQTNYASLSASIQGGRVNYLSVVEPAAGAAPVRSPIPLVSLTVLIATVASFALSVAAALLLEYIDSTIRSDEDANRVLGLPVIGTVAKFGRTRKPAERLVLLRQPDTSVSEAYRILRTNLQFCGVSTPMTRLMVASAVPGEGKSTTACNLAISMAQAGKQVILCDTDLRRPSMNQVLDITAETGLTSLLLDRELSVEDALIPGPVAGLRILPSGPLPPNPGELLGSDAMKERVAELESLADLIVFDSPAVLGVADPTILATLVHGVLLVVAAGRTRSDLVRRATVRLQQAGVPIVGVVLNMVAERRHRAFDYYRRAAAETRKRQGVPGPGQTPLLPEGGGPTA